MRKNSLKRYFKMNRSQKAIIFDYADNKKMLSNAWSIVIVNKDNEIDTLDIEVNEKDCKDKMIEFIDDFSNNYTDYGKRIELDTIDWSIDNIEIGKTKDFHGCINTYGVNVKLLKAVCDIIKPTKDVKVLGKFSDITSFWRYVIIVENDNTKEIGYLLSTINY